jgi:hypothetical protein
MVTTARTDRDDSRPFRVSLKAATRQAAPRPLDLAKVEDHLLDDAAELAFRQALRHGLASIHRSDRPGSLNTITGHVAESVTATLLVDQGWHLVEQFTSARSGGHGIDLAMLSPDAADLFVIEVKGTLVPNRWPRLTRGEIAQFSTQWLDRPDNPGMSNLEVIGEDVSGLVALLNFASRQWKALATDDFEAFVGLGADADLADPASWFA